MEIGLSDIGLLLPLLGKPVSSRALPFISTCHHVWGEGAQLPARKGSKRKQALVPPMRSIMTRSGRVVRPILPGITIGRPLSSPAAPLVFEESDGSEASMEMSLDSEATGLGHFHQNSPNLGQTSIAAAAVPASTSPVAPTPVLSPIHDVSTSSPAPVISSADFGTVRRELTSLLHLDLADLIAHAQRAYLLARQLSRDPALSEGERAILDLVYNHWLASLWRPSCHWRIPSAWPTLTLQGLHWH